ncbi:SRPBCC family protein [Cohnella cellulosilytica]|uniref:SRPBCC family protein n=1 Tax=Cohnella cellulosilytica TaxID=986710 RepID=A0ABW2FJB0_9BACL
MNDPVVKVGMLIRRPVQEVFNALVDPAVTTKFWFTKSSGRLEAGKRIRWDWEMYGVSADIDVTELEENKRIVIEWPSRVEWTFTSYGDATYVHVTNSGLEGGAEEAVGSMGGFTMVLCALKALLEHNVILTVVADKEPPS